MSKKFILFVVISLGLLIIIAFSAVIYGMYLKISTTEEINFNSEISFSSNLLNNEQIKNIEVIDKSRLLIVVESDTIIKGYIFDINNNKIIQIIE